MKSLIFGANSKPPCLIGRCISMQMHAANYAEIKADASIFSGPYMHPYYFRLGCISMQMENIGCTSKQMGAVQSPSCSQKQTFISSMQLHNYELIMRLINTYKSRLQTGRNCYSFIFITWQRSSYHAYLCENFHFLIMKKRTREITMSLINIFKI